MPSFGVDRTTITAFEIDDTYLFSHYFEQDDVFAKLSEYYNDAEYRFEVPAQDLDSVRTVLDDHFYEPEVADDTEAFCVVKEKYTDHADILRNAVFHTSRREYTVFLMKDALTVEQAVEQGATRLAEADLEVRL